MMSSYCIAGISPDLKTLNGKRKGKMVEFYEFNDYVHDVLLGLVTGLDA